MYGVGAYTLGAQDYILTATFIHSMIQYTSTVERAHTTLDSSSKNLPNQHGIHKIRTYK